MDKGFGLLVPQPGFTSESPDVIFSDDEIVEAAFQHFRKVGFPYKNFHKHICMMDINRLARTGNKELQNTAVGYGVADTYHPHRFHARHNSKKLSPYDAFISDDDWVRTCLRKTLELGGHLRDVGIMGMGTAPVAGVKSCSNFRPGFALLQYRKYCPPGGTVLDSSTGYGGRLVGFMASSCGRYIGIDPNTDVYHGNLRMVADFGRSDDVELYCCPAEDLEHEKVAGRCDFSFTSPPYFCAEIYSSDPSQSCNRYLEAKSWRNGFLLPMMRLQEAALKPGCFTCINIADVKIRDKIIPLVKWTITAGQKAGLEYVGMDYYKLKRHFGKGGDEFKHKWKTEAVLKFRKP